MFPLTRLTLFYEPTLNCFWCSSTILEQKYDFRYEKGMFYANTYFFRFTFICIYYKKVNEKKFCRPTVPICLEMLVETNFFYALARLILFAELRSTTYLLRGWKNSKSTLYNTDTLLTKHKAAKNKQYNIYYMQQYIYIFYQPMGPYMQDVHCCCFSVKHVFNKRELQNTN